MSIQSVRDLYQTLTHNELHICKESTTEEFASVIDEEILKGVRMGKYNLLFKIACIV